MKNSSDTPTWPFLQGGGEMGELIRATEWTATPPGRPENWPSALKAAVSMMLSSKFPTLICWGADFIQFYNDSFRPINGKSKHPQALGGSARNTYAEIWPTIGPMFADVMNGETHGFPDFMVQLDRNGYIEDCYFDFSYSPIRNEDGSIGGIWVVCVETTEKVNAVNRLDTYRQNIKNMIRQAPVGMCIVSGIPLFVEEVNDLFLEIIGKERKAFDQVPYWEVIAEAKAYYEPITDRVQATGETFHAKEHEILLIRKGIPETIFVDFVYEPMRDAGGNITAIMIVATEVTDKILARSILQNNNDEMAAANEELIATNEELAAAQQQLEDLYSDIKDNESKLDQVIDLLPASVTILIGDEFVIERTNPSNLAYWQKTKEQVIGKPLLEAMPELANQAFPGQLKQVLHDGITIFETAHLVRLVADDGLEHISYVDYSYQPLLNKDGHRIGVLVMSNDVTDRRLRQDELAAINEELAAANEELAAANESAQQFQESLIRQNEELSKARQEALQQRNRLTEFFMQAPAGICILSGPELSFELVNPLYQQLFPGREILGKTMLEAIPEVKESAIGGILQGVLQTGKAFEGHELLIPLARTTEGPVEDRYFDFIYQPRFNEEHLPDGILVFVIEVTEQVRAKRKITRAEENLRMAIQAGEMGTYSINTRTLEFNASARLKELFGFGPDEAMPAEAFINQIREDYRFSAQNMADNAIFRGGRFEMEYPVVGHQDGKERWLRGIGTTVPGGEGADSYFTGTVLDITESRADDQRKNDFIGMVSHELKTPLTTLNAIIQVANLKLKTNPDTFLAGAMEKAHVQVRRMSNMINGFLNVSRLESGKIDVVKQPFNLDELLEEVISENELTITTHAIHFDNCGHITINADRDKINSVISNLLSNAIKYSPQSKLIDIACARKGNKAIVSVRDYGMGVKRHELEKLFERYYRVESNTTQHISGFGIGLYLSAEIIHRHGGEIWAESEYGQGSTFYFSLPLNC